VHDATHLDLYQLTSLVTHHEAVRSADRVVMTFFSRRLPRREADGETARPFLLWAGLRRCLEHLEHARISDVALEILKVHPVLGPALRGRPELVHALRDWRFRGVVRAPAEGTLLYAGRAVRMDGSRLDVPRGRPLGVRPVPRDRDRPALGEVDRDAPPVVDQPPGDGGQQGRAPGARGEARRSRPHRARVRHAAHPPRSRRGRCLRRVRRRGCTRRATSPLTFGTACRSPARWTTSRCRPGSARGCPSTRRRRRSSARSATRSPTTTCCWSTPTTRSASGRASGPRSRPPGVVRRASASTRTSRRRP
jgi:hypothetical protein